MIIEDFHTHTPRPGAIVNISPGEETVPGLTYSCGIHPWHLGETDEQTWRQLDETLGRPEVVAVGECGIDMLRGPEPEMQEAALERHARLAEKHGKPLIIHCVRAWQQVMALRRRLKPSQRWIIHGFRGKPQLARQLLDAGFDISLGPRFNPATAAIVPADRLHIETDDSDTSIADVRRAVEAARSAGAFSADTLSTPV